MICLALDPATLTGWAVGMRRNDNAGSQCFESGVKDLAPAGAKVHPGARFRRLRNLMVDVKKKYPSLHLIAFELPIGNSTSQIQKAYSHGYVAIIQMFCADHGLATRGVHVGTLKKFMTGRGAAEKSEMIAAVKERGFDPRDDNEADAIAIMLWALQ